jgi:hypothetical protein
MFSSPASIVAPALVPYTVPLLAGNTVAFANKSLVIGGTGTAAAERAEAGPVPS